MWVVISGQRVGLDLAVYLFLPPLLAAEEGTEIVKNINIFNKIAGEIEAIA